MFYSCCICEALRTESLLISMELREILDENHLRMGLSIFGEKGEAMNG